MNGLARPCRLGRLRRQRLWRFQHGFLSDKSLSDRYDSHALQYVAKAKGGRGQKGGLSEYAERIGRHAGLLTDYRNAAAVAETLHSSEGLLDKAKHLAAIHKLPEEAWGVAQGAFRQKFASTLIRREHSEQASIRTKGACSFKR